MLRSASGQLAYHLTDNTCTSAYLICHTVNMGELQRVRYGQNNGPCEAAKSDKITEMSAEKKINREEHYF